MILIRAYDSLAQEVEREQETPIFIGIIIFNFFFASLTIFLRRKQKKIKIKTNPDSN